MPDRLDPKAPENSVRSFCLRLLERGDLACKLAPPRTADGERLDDLDPGPAAFIDAPARDPGLEMSVGLGKLPRPGELASLEARALCLARFAHHELMAVELFAWALLRWPDAPAGLRRGLLGALADEQKHCRLYLDRLEAHGAAFTDFAHSDYFWKQAPAIAASPHGVRAFLAAMGLTLEQANLDFSVTYRDAFREAGDEASARVCQVVHDDEVRHVGLAAEWMRRLSGETDFDEIEAYERCVPFPLGASRAKGRRFEPRPRRAAGLSPELIEHVRTAKSPQQDRPRRGRASDPR